MFGFTIRHSPQKGTGSSSSYYSLSSLNGSLVEEPQDLPTGEPPTCLLVVHDAKGGGHHKVTELWVGLVG